MAKVLVVEDDPTLSKSITTLFLEEGFEAETVCSGADALQLLSYNKFDLIVLDWNLPDMEGVAICRQLRQNQDGSRVLMLTGKSHIEDKDEGYSSGADDYLTKPFESRELLMRARALLRRPESMYKEHIKIGAVLLNRIDSLVLVEDLVVQMHKRDFDLLELLMLNPGKYFTPAALLARIWASSDEASAAAVRQAILRVRKNLGPCGSYIESTYGLGYRFVAVAGD